MPSQSGWSVTRRPQDAYVANGKRPHNRGLLGWWNDVFCDAVGASDDEVPGDLTLVRQAGGVAGMAGVDSSAVRAPVIEMSRIFLEKTSRSMSIRRHSLRL